MTSMKLLEKAAIFPYDLHFLTSGLFVVVLRKCCFKILYRGAALQGNRCREVNNSGITIRSITIQQPDGFYVPGKDSLP